MFLVAWLPYAWLPGAWLPGAWLSDVWLPGGLPGCLVAWLPGAWLLGSNGNIRRFVWDVIQTPLFTNTKILDPNPNINTA